MENITQLVSDLIQQMRELKMDTQHCEVKTAGYGLPKNLPETLSAFANTTGGVVILGVSEKDGFKPAPDFDTQRIYASALAIGDRLTPIVRPEVHIVPFEGVQLVVMQVNALPPQDKPCFVTLQGQYGGSYIRTGDGDRKMSIYEVNRLKEQVRQPKYDCEVIKEASMADLDQDLVKQLLARARLITPRVFGKLPDEEILLKLGAVGRDGEALHPTLAGLVALGTYPQQFFPRLNVTFTAYAGRDKTPLVDTGERYLDTQTLVGPIPMVLSDAVQAVQRNMKTGAVIQGAFRKDVPDYPLEAVREAVANALQHRDYSPEGRGSHIQVNMYADRLEILNPGGLYGATTVESLGHSGISSTRNVYLSRLLELTPYGGDGFVVENRGTGFQNIGRALKQAGMMQPEVHNSIGYFTLIFHNRKLAHTQPITWTDVSEGIVNLLSSRESASVREIVDVSGLSRTTVYKQIQKLVAEGIIEPKESGRSPKQRYRLIRRL